MVIKEDHEMTALILNTIREGYTINQVPETMTVGDLINFLEDFNEDTPIYLSFDNGYTYGGISEYSFNEDESEEEDY